mmetsp:Transcript_124/g.216  ORF Transcript_124/g.216 Transcript_124/m.216 type:complete len:92 (-) Transcript_124:47-322(-)
MVRKLNDILNSTEELDKPVYEDVKFNFLEDVVYNFFQGFFRTGAIFLAYASAEYFYEWKYGRTLQINRVIFGGESKEKVSSLTSKVTSTTQ